MTATETCDLLTTCSYVQPQKNSSKNVMRFQAKYRKSGTRNPARKDENFSATKGRTNIRKEIGIDDIKVEISTREESTEYLGQMTTFQQQETTEIRNRIRAAWAAFQKYRQELTSRTYMLKHPLWAFRRSGIPDDELRLWCLDTHKRA